MTRGIKLSVRGTYDVIFKSRILFFIKGLSGGVVVEWFGPRTCEQQVPGSNPGRGGCALGQGTLSALSSLSEET